MELSYSPSPDIILAVRACKYVQYLADVIIPSKCSLIKCPEDLESYHVDLLGEYGPTKRLVFFVRNELEIFGRLAIVQSHLE